MVVRSSPSDAGPPQAPAEFVAAIRSMRRASLRPEISCEEMPAPQRIAPYSTALTADVTVDEVEVGTGRLILLHDPAGNDAWDGTYRCVAYARAELEHDMVSDPLLSGAAWSWLIEALESNSADYTAISGTVTVVGTETFGSMVDDGGSAQVEIRASWTPIFTSPAPRSGSTTDPDLAPHVEAWGEALCTAVGLQPLPPGVASLAHRLGQRGV